MQRSIPSEIQLYLPLLEEAARLGALQRQLMATGLPGGMAPVHLRVLNHLVWDRDGVTPGEIAAWVGLPKSTASLAVRQMDARGWVLTGGYAADLRTRCVWISPDGHAARAEALAGLNEPMRWLDRMTPYQDSVRRMRSELVGVRKRMRTALDAPKPRPKPVGI